VATNVPHQCGIFRRQFGDHALHHGFPDNRPPYLYIPAGTRQVAFLYVDVNWLRAESPRGIRTLSKGPPARYRTGIRFCRTLVHHGESHRNGRGSPRASRCAAAFDATLENLTNIHSHRTDVRTLALQRTRRCMRTNFSCHALQFPRANGRPSHRVPVFEMHGPSRRTSGRGLAMYPFNARAVAPAYVFSAGA